MTLGERLKAARKQARISQQTLAERVGTSIVNVRCWESDAYAPRVYYIKQLCEVLDVSADWLLEVKR